MLPLRRGLLLPLSFATFSLAASSAVADYLEGSLFTNSPASAPPILDHPYVAGELLVRFDQGVTPEQASERALSVGANATRRRGNRGLYSVYTPRDEPSMRQVMTRLVSLPGVRYVEPNYIGSGGGAPNDPLFAQQWHLEQTSDVDIDLVAAWDLEPSPDRDWRVRIAILDSGTRFDHPELNTNVWTNPGEVPNNFLDDDLNGYVDDVNGWDFIDDDNDPSDPLWHGTAVSGVAVARNNNSFQTAGVSQSAVYLPVQVLDENNDGPTSALIEALEYVADLGGTHTFHAVNLSLVDYPQTTALSDALAYAAAKSVLVGCAGNDGPLTADGEYPGAHPSVISVGWTEPDDQINPDSATGSSVDFAAPGTSIKTVSVFPPFLPLESTSAGGCSFAAPIVSGLASLLQAHCPNISEAMLRQYIAAGAVDLGSAGWDSTFGWGRVNAEESLEALLADLILCFNWEEQLGSGAGWDAVVP
jgi:subtilisin family serine protease